MLTLTGTGSNSTVRGVLSKNEGFGDAFRQIFQKFSACWWWWALIAKPKWWDQSLFCASFSRSHVTLGLSVVGVSGCQWYEVVCSETAWVHNLPLQCTTRYADVVTILSLSYPSCHSHKSSWKWKCSQTRKDDYNSTKLGEWIMMHNSWRWMPFGTLDLWLYSQLARNNS